MVQDVLEREAWKLNPKSSMKQICGPKGCPHIGWKFRFDTLRSQSISLCFSPKDNRVWRPILWKELRNRTNFWLPFPVKLCTRFLTQLVLRKNPQLPSGSLHIAFLREGLGKRKSPIHPYYTRSSCTAQPSQKSTSNLSVAYNEAPNMVQALMTSFNDIVSSFNRLSGGTVVGIQISKKAACSSDWGNVTLR